MTRYGRLRNLLLSVMTRWVALPTAENGADDTVLDAAVICGHSTIKPAGLSGHANDRRSANALSTRRKHPLHQLGPELTRIRQ